MKTPATSAQRINSIRVMGRASAEEVAALLAVLSCEPAPPERSAQWRLIRRDALRRTTSAAGEVPPN